MPVEEMKRSISDTAVSMTSAAFNARLQGAEGVTSATNTRKSCQRLNKRNRSSLLFATR